MKKIIFAVLVAVSFMAYSNPAKSPNSYKWEYLGWSNGDGYDITQPSLLEDKNGNSIAWIKAHSPKYENEFENFDSMIFEVKINCTNETIEFLNFYAYFKTGASLQIPNEEMKSTRKKSNIARKDSYLDDTLYKKVCIERENKLYLTEAKVIINEINFLNSKGWDAIKISSFLTDKDKLVAIIKSELEYCDEDSVYYKNNSRERMASICKHSLIDGLKDWVETVSSDTIDPLVMATSSKEATWRGRDGYARVNFHLWAGIARQKQFRNEKFKKNMP